MTRVSYRTVEYHRFGPPEDVLKRENQYIRTTGWDEVAEVVHPAVDAKAFQRAMNALSFAVASDSDRREAIKLLKSAAEDFLATIAPVGSELLQIDLVTNAAELWAFPFEACFAAHPEWLGQTDAGVVLTRRIRGNFAETTPPWPATPRILFLHAPVARDLSQDLIDKHRAGLVEAIDPWSGGKPVLETDLLRVREVRSVDDVAKERAAFGPAHVHVLAHGAKIPSDPLEPQSAIWGLRFGDEKTPGSSPDEVAEALSPADGLPLVVTLAACDAANQQNTLFAPTSVVQELHRCGVPVVIGSQLPLTQPGSLLLTRTFYKCLLAGEDVRAALHAVRVDLKANEEDAGHDWLSVVGYVRLPPEGYASHLATVNLAMRMKLLRAASEKAATLIARRAPVAEFAPVEAQLADCLNRLRLERDQLAGRSDLLEENRGMEASALKRHAELLFWRACVEGPWSAADFAESRAQLQRAFEAYRAAFDDAPRSHWVGIQQLVLEGALMGRVTREQDWLFLQRTAELLRDRPQPLGREDYWSCGTLAELYLIAPLAGERQDLEAAIQAASLLVERARKSGDQAAIDSTRQQFGRYTTWWTRDRGFFGTRQDFAVDARTLLDRVQWDAAPSGR